MPLSLTGAGDVTGLASINTTVSSTELGYLDGVTSALQTQINTKANDATQGLYLVTSQSFTAASTISINNCFTSTYQNYVLMLSAKGSTSGSGTPGIRLRLRAGGVDATDSNHWSNVIFSSSGGGPTRSYESLQTSVFVGCVFDYTGLCVVNISNPAVATQTAFTQQTTAYGSVDALSGTAGMAHLVSAAYDGCTLIVSSGTITGNVRIFGVRNS